MAANSNHRPKSVDISSHVSGKFLFWSLTILSFNLTLRQVNAGFSCCLALEGAFGGDFPSNTKGFKDFLMMICT